MTANGPIGEPLDQAQDRPLGIPRGSPSTPADAGLRTGVRSLLSLAVTALGNVIGFYFGSRASS